MITPQEYQDRRNRLAQQLPTNSVAIIAAAQELIRNGDAHYRFRQNSNFYYLTGFNEPDATLIVYEEDGNTHSILFNQVRNPAVEQWTGKRLGQSGAMSELLMDAAFGIDTLDEELPRLLANKSAVYYCFDNNTRIEQQIRQAIQQLKAQVRRGIEVPTALHDLEPLLSDMRLFKSDAELALMKKAADISVEAHKQAMRLCSKLHYEHELEAELTYQFSRGGCRYVAYDPIVGSGANACILHYTANDQPLHAGDLVLIDAGGEYQNYAADITRTFPISGVFSPEQKMIYELVLKAQKAGIAAIKPGLAWNMVQQTIIRILTTGLVELNILQGHVDELIAAEAYKPFYMHNSGHWLGLDVHDAGQYKLNKEWRCLEAGMVLTVEPGLYISADATDVEPCWRGIGVRIEDDVVVTATGHEVLTAALPVDVDEIEALMRG